VTPFALAVRAIAAYNLTRHMNLRVAGRDYVPRRGPAILAARHYHHLFDGAALVMGLHRQPSIFVALDWTHSPWERLVMETACNLADWPVALRADNLSRSPTSAFAKREVLRYVRTSVEKAAALLGRGELVAIFPEGYPTIDPAGSRKPAEDAFLPFAPGFVAIVDRVRREHGEAPPVIPVGFTYAPAAKGRTDVTMRLGPPVVRGGESRAAFVRDVEARVHALSR
jgi:putative membrane protein